MQTEINQGGSPAETATLPQDSAAVNGAIAATAPGKLRIAFSREKWGLSAPVIWRCPAPG